MRSFILPPKAKAGFTLIELLVVVAIIGLLASIVLVSLTTVRLRARDARRLADIRQIRLALELYYDSNNRYPVAAGTWYCLGHTTATTCGNEQYRGNDALNAMLVPYLPVIPDDPKRHGHNPSTCWGDSYQYSSAPDGMTGTLHWYYENASAPTATACLPGTYGGVNACGNYCFLAVP